MSFLWQESLFACPLQVHGSGPKHLAPDALPDATKGLGTKMELNLAVIPKLLHCGSFNFVWYTLPNRLFFFKPTQKHSAILTKAAHFKGCISHLNSWINLILHYSTKYVPVLEFSDYKKLNINNFRQWCGTHPGHFNLRRTYSLSTSELIFSNQRVAGFCHYVIKNSLFLLDPLNHCSDLGNVIRGNSGVVILVRKAPV